MLRGIQVVVPQPLVGGDGVGVVGEVVYSGSVTQYRVAVEGAGTWVVEDQNRAAGRRLATGVRVWVVWAAADLRGLPA